MRRDRTLVTPGRDLPPTHGRGRVDDQFHPTNFCQLPCWPHPRPNATVVDAPRGPRLLVLAGHSDRFDSAEGKGYIAVCHACPFHRALTPRARR
jgi:hypothetical protein